jgi:hypothetical protein
LAAIEGFSSAVLALCDSIRGWRAASTKNAGRSIWRAATGDISDACAKAAARRVRLLPF